MDVVPTTFGEFLTFIGSATAIGFVLSWIVGNWAFFNRATAQGKTAILLLVSILMSLGSLGLVRFVPAGIIEQAQPYYQTILGAITIVLASQAYHKVVDAPAAKANDTAQALNNLLGKG